MAAVDQMTTRLLTRNAADQAPEPIRAVAFPRPREKNPYQVLLHSELEARGVVFVPTPPALSPSWVRRAHRTIDVIHLHWLEFVLFNSGLRWSRLRNWLRVARYVLALRGLKARQVRILWTAHNVQPHENRQPALYRIAAKATARYADAVIVHSAHAGKRLGESGTRPKRLSVAYHGNYCGVYPSSVLGRRDARRTLGLAPDTYVFLMLGRVRPYKRLTHAVAAFRSMPALKAELLIAGEADQPELVAEIERLAADDPRIHLHLRYIPNEAVGMYHAAADAAVLNYAEVFSSGAMLLAWSHGLPVVAPRGGTADEVALDGALEPMEEGLGEAMVGVMAGSQEARRGAALATASRNTWSSMVDQILPLYEGRPSPTA